MNHSRLREYALYGVSVALLALPVAAQNDSQASDPHEWYKKEVQGKIDPATGKPYPNSAPGTTTTQGTATSTEAGQGDDVQRIANELLNKSLGSVNENYRGKHKWFADDFMGNFLSWVGPINLILIAVGGGAAYLAYTCGVKKGKQEATKKPD